MSNKACKELIDNGGRIQALAESLATSSKTQAQSLLGFGIQENPEGNNWLTEVKIFQEQTIARLEKLNAKAMELCMTQPIA